MLQIQPTYRKHFDYEALAESQGLFFEALELSFDGVSADAADWYRNCGKVRSLHGVFMDANPGSGDAALRALSQKRYEDSCRQAIECHAENILFHSTCFPFLRGAYLDGWAGKCADFYMFLAEKYSDLTFFIENAADIDPVPMQTLMRRISVPNVKICLDIGHIHYSGTPLEAWLEALGDRTAYLHLSDNHGVYDDHLPIGDGTVNWQNASALCSSLPGNIPVTLEVGDSDGIRRSLKYIREHALFGGVL